jgi:hypothetical protein
VAVVKKRTHNRDYVARDVDLDKFEEIIARMMNGEAITTICSHEDEPSYSVFMSWVVADKERFEKYSRAKQIQVDYYVEDCVVIADTDSDPQRARNRIVARQWHASKISPRKYGERIQTDSTVNVTNNVKLDLSSMTPEARAELRDSLIDQMRSANPKQLENVPYLSVTR